MVAIGVFAAVLFVVCSCLLSVVIRIRRIRKDLLNERESLEKVREELAYAKKYDIRDFDMIRSLYKISYPPEAADPNKDCDRDRNQSKYWECEGNCHLLIVTKKDEYILLPVVTSGAPVTRMISHRAVLSIVAEEDGVECEKIR